MPSIDRQFPSESPSTVQDSGMFSNVFVSQSDADVSLDGFNRALICEFQLCDKKGQPIQGSPVVRGQLIEIQESVSATWTSPFEASSESHAPTLAALLQTGNLKTLAIAASQKLGIETTQVSKDAIDALGNLEGRSGMTKLNSTQVFTGATPLQYDLTIVFKALRKPEEEVERKVDLLKGWTVPEFLADGISVSKLLDLALSQGSAINSLWPSKVPPFVLIYYGGRAIGPLVIERVNDSLGTPRGSSGKRIFAKVQISLQTLRALDSRDFQAQLEGKGYQP